MKPSWEVSSPLAAAWAHLPRTYSIGAPAESWRRIVATKLGGDPVVEHQLVLEALSVALQGSRLARCCGRPSGPLPAQCRSTSVSSLVGTRPGRSVVAGDPPAVAAYVAMLHGMGAQSRPQDPLPSGVLSRWSWRSVVPFPGGGAARPLVAPGPSPPASVRPRPRVRRHSWRHHWGFSMCAFSKRAQGRTPPCVCCRRCRQMGRRALLCCKA